MSGRDVAQDLGYRRFLLHGQKDALVAFPISETADRHTRIRGKPPLPRLCISSIWRIIFFDPPPFMAFIIFCIGCRYDRLTCYECPLLRFAGGI